MNKSSKTEDILYEAMLDIGLRPRRQYPISRHHVDFAFPKQKLIIEVDGWEYHKDRKQREIDEKRRDIAENLGWRVKRFTAEEVYEDPRSIAWKVHNLLKDKKSIKDYNYKLKDKFYKEDYSSEVLNNYNKNLKHKRKSKIDKIVKISVIIGVIIIFIWSFWGRHFFENPTTSIQNTSEFKQEDKQADLTVEGSETDIIIKNNQQKDISLNVTYRIYSNWFGIDSRESKIFEIRAKEEKSFKVYNNEGCLTAPCSVSIISYEEL